jgi:hypothetical protein
VYQFKVKKYKPTITSLNNHGILLPANVFSLVANKYFLYGNSFFHDNDGYLYTGDGYLLSDDGYFVHIPVHPATHS